MVHNIRNNNRRQNSKDNGNGNRTDFPLPDYSVFPNLQNILPGGIQQCQTSRRHLGCQCYDERRQCEVCNKQCVNHVEDNRNTDGNGKRHCHRAGRLIRTDGKHTRQGKHRTRGQVQQTGYNQYHFTIRQNGRYRQLHCNIGNISVAQEIGVHHRRYDNQYQQNKENRKFLH